ncbi:MAG: Y4bD/Y4pK family protein [Chloroflexi bacterium]|nr:Y4bD/Y4pK family protein [Chloroflexota bacterium]
MTITHPFHPLYGQQVEVVRSRWGADPDLIVRLPEGGHVAVAVDWTDYAAATEFDRPPGPPHLLDFAGLAQARQLIDRICQESRGPAPGDGAETCTASRHAL